LKEKRDMVYALWDTRSTNMVAAYDNERDALALVLSGIERNGPQDTDTIVLEVEDEEGELLYSLQGQELADLARKKLRPAQLAGE
jgi:hypothetical protein